MGKLKLSKDITSQIPLFIVEVGSAGKYWKNTKTGKYIKTENLEKYLEDNKARDTVIPLLNYWWNKD